MLSLSNDTDYAMAFAAVVGEVTRVTDFMAALREKARVSPQRIVFPESHEENIILAARAGSR